MRNYGRFTTSIWRDPDFTVLTAKQQAVYFMLATQPEVSAAGTLPLTLRRWSNMASDLTPDDLRKVLLELEESAGRHIVVDEDTEELLIRKFVKFDGGMGNEKRRPVIQEAASGVSSRRIIASLAREMRHIGHGDMASDLWGDTASDSPSDTASDRASDEPADRASDSHADTQSGFDRVVVKQGEYDPQPTTRFSQPATTQPATSAPVAAEAADATAQTIVAEWIERAPKRPPGQVIGQASRAIKQMLAEGIDPDDVRRGLSAWMTKGLHPSALPSVVNEVMNAGPRTMPRKRNADDRVRDGLELAQRLLNEPQPRGLRAIGGNTP